MTTIFETLSESAQQAVISAVAETLGDTYDCTRVWSAWNVGTMGESDFYPVVDQEDRLVEVAEAALQALKSAGLLAIPTVEDADAAEVPRVA